MTDFSFTYDTYVDVLEHFVEEGLEPKKFDEPVDTDTLLLRHDIDFSPRKAQKVAEIESKHDITSTFFFLLTSPFYNPHHSETQTIINNILSMGHDVCLHFNSHQYWSSQPEADTVTTSIQNELSILQMSFGHETNIVSFHNPPNWILNKNFEDIINTYEPRFFDNISYRADSVQRWRDNPPLSNVDSGPLQVLTHPVLWGNRDGSTLDRLREERDYLQKSITQSLNSNSNWDGVWGIQEQ